MAKRLDSQKKDATKQRILYCAADLFAVKGFTETTIRELAIATGIKSSSIYYHFASKNDILVYMMEDYASHYSSEYDNLIMLLKNGENASIDEIIFPLYLAFSEDSESYYNKTFGVILQEQYRYPAVREFISKYILQRELLVKTMIDVLKKHGYISQFTDPDFWMKVSSSLIYAFSSRSMLGIGDKSSNFTGMGMAELLKFLYELMLSKGRT